MKTWSLTPILTSAYLSAMLTSGLAPIRPTAILASAIDPMAAQKALQTAISAATSSGWVDAASANLSLSPSAAQVSASTQPPKNDPVMTAELMARMVKQMGKQTTFGTVDAKVCQVFKLCPGTADMQVRQLETENPEGHYIMMPTAPGATDIIIVRTNKDGSLDCFLTDKDFKLRAAAVVTSSSATLILNEKAAERFKDELSLFAREASDLPPTGTAVAAGS